MPSRPGPRTGCRNPCPALRAVSDVRQELAALVQVLRARRDELLAAWRHRVHADPMLARSGTLTRMQLNDHVPDLLDDWERRLLDPARAEPDQQARADGAVHGGHRWQQGFDLAQLTREFGWLNECVLAELDRHAALHPHVPAAVHAVARQVWARVHGAAVSGSAERHAALQVHAAGQRQRELEQAMAALRELEAQRAQLWRQAAHDLRGNLGVVATATAGLASPGSNDAVRGRFMELLDLNVGALHRMVEDIASLARLHGEQETRRLEPMDAAQVIRELAEGLRPEAEARDLLLELDGPAALPVDGDPVKLRRIVQNLLLNALRYTERGGVTVVWGLAAAGQDGPGAWFVEVADSGPGLGGAEPGDGEPAPHASAGEGLGLTIVRRLCDLLQGTLSCDTSAGRGTVFRVELPRSYAAPQA